MVNQEVYQPVKNKPRFFYGYIVVVASLVILLLQYGPRNSFGVFFKPMTSELGWTRAMTSGAFTLSMLVQGSSGILMGRLNDRFGPRFIMAFCCFFLGLGFLLMSLTSSIWQLYLFYGVVIGIGVSGVFVVILSTVARWFVKRRGTMTGIVLTGGGLGTLVMPPVISRLIAAYDWRMAYIIVGIVVLTIGILAAQLLRRDPTKMGLVPYGQTERKEQELASGAEGLSFMEAAHTWQFWMVAVIFFCAGYSIFTVNVHLVPHITDLRISATTAANIFAVTGGVRIIGGIVLGGAADRIGNRWVLTISLILMSGAMFWLVPVTGVWMFSLFAVIYGLGNGGSAPMESTVVAELFGMKSHGLILGFISFAFTIGGAAGPFLAGYLFDINGDYKLAFLISASIGVVAMVLAAALRPVKILNTSSP